jgi:beta-lactamase regulating signal transducer with metallopeptidase domain
MVETSRWLTTFLLNAVWQITAITLLALVCERLLRRMSSRYLHRAWALALIACVLVPLTTVLIQNGVNPVIGEAKRAEPATNPVPSALSPRLSIPLRSLSHSISVPPMLSGALLWLFSAVLFYRATRLGWIVHRTYGMRQRAYVREVPLHLSEVEQRCRHAFSLATIPLLCSSDVRTPATVGFRHPVILLPKSFFETDMSEDDLASALSHEFAHVQRCDFALNLLYEFVYLAVCFHPFTAVMKSRISHTRELACDEMAARVLPSGARYASSLLRIARSMLSGSETKSSYALGLFDTNALEERIVKILETTNASKRWARALRLTAVSFVGAVALGTSVFSLKLAAENSTDLKQFAGTWECKYKGRTFFTLKMAVKDGVLGGSAVHSTRVGWIDGEIVPDTDETRTEKIFDTHASAKELTIKLADGPNDTNAIALNFKLIGGDEAEAKLIVEKQPDAPPQKKPWHFERTSNTQ